MHKRIETRLRQRIDELTEERDYWRALVVNVCPECGESVEFRGRYCTDECRTVARRRSWRLSKRRTANAVRIAKMSERAG